MEERTFDDVLTRLEELVGRISPGQHDFLRTCISEDEMGVWRAARNVAGMTGVTSPVGLFLSKLKNGQHVGPTKPPPMRTRMYPPLPVPSEEQAAHYRKIQAQWGLIQRWSHHPQVKRLRRELTLTCEDPNNPTHEEAALMRETVIALIEIL